MKVCDHCNCSDEDGRYIFMNVHGVYVCEECSHFRKELDNFVDSLPRGGHIFSIPVEVEE